MSTPTKPPKLEEVHMIESVYLDKLRGSTYGTWLVKLEYFDGRIPIERGGPVQPRKGMEMRVLGDIEDDPQGIEIGGIVVFRRTDAEQEEFEKEKLAEEFAHCNARFDTESERLLKRESVLPEKLKARIEEIRRATPDKDGFENLFNVMYLEEEVMISELAGGLELMLWVEYDVSSFYELPSTNRMRDSWAEMRSTMLAIAEKMDPTWGEYIKTYFHNLQWPIEMTHYQLGEIRTLAFELVSGRSEKRTQQAYEWSELRAEYNYYKTAAAAEDPQVQQEFDERYREIQQLDAEQPVQTLQKLGQ